MYPEKRFVGFWISWDRDIPLILSVFVCTLKLLLQEQIHLKGYETGNQGHSQIIFLAFLTFWGFALNSVVFSYSFRLLQQKQNSFLGV